MFPTILDTNLKNRKYLMKETQQLNRPQELLAEFMGQFNFKRIVKNVSTHRQREPRAVRVMSKRRRETGNEEASLGTGVLGRPGR